MNNLSFSFRFCMAAVVTLATTALSVNGQAFLTNKLVAYYPFNGNAADESGQGMNGTIAGATPAPDRLGVPGAAYRFDGTNAVITVAPLSSANLAELTVSAWVKPAGFPAVQGSIVEKWRAFSYSLEDYALVLYSDLRLAFGNGRHGSGYFEQPNHCTLVSTNPLSPGRWHHVAVTLDSAGTGKLWINGVLQANDNILPLLPPASEPVRIGQMLHLNGDIVDTFNGSIDDVRIYDRALPASEVRQLYVLESGPRVDLLKAVRPSFSALLLGTNYQLQVSADMSTWTNAGSPFTATNTSMVYPQYWDVDNWNQLFFRLQVAL